MTPVMWLEFRVASLLKYRAKLLMFLGDMDLRKSPISFRVSRHCPIHVPVVCCTVEPSYKDHLKTSIIILSFTHTVLGHSVC